MVTLYVLKGETGKRYVGITNDLSRRIKEHYTRHSKGGQQLGDFSVIYTEIFDDYVELMLIAYTELNGQA